MAVFHLLGQKNPTDCRPRWAGLDPRGIKWSPGVILVVSQTQHISPDATSEPQSLRKYIPEASATQVTFERIVSPNPPPPPASVQGLNHGSYPQLSLIYQHDVMRYILFAEN